MNLHVNKSSDGFELPKLFSERRPKKIRKQRKKSQRKIGRKLLRFVTFCLLGVLLISVVPIVALRWIDPLTSSFMMQRYWEAYSKDESGFVLQYQWVDWEDISPELKIAVVAAEDQLW